MNYRTRDMIDFSECAAKDSRFKSGDLKVGVVFAQRCSSDRNRSHKEKKTKKQKKIIIIK